MFSDKIWILGYLGVFGNLLSASTEIELESRQWGDNVWEILLAIVHTVHLSLVWRGKQGNLLDPARLKENRYELTRGLFQKVN